MSYSTQTGNFQVENLGTDRYLSDVSGLAGGGTAVLLSRNVYPESFFDLEIYDAAGAQIGATLDLRALADNDAAQSNEFRVMGLSNGNVLVTYNKSDSGANNVGLNNAYFFVLDQNGQKIVNDVQINTSSGASLTRSVDLVELENGNIAFSFQRADNLSFGTRVFTPDGVPVAGETLVANANGVTSAIAANTDGSYLVTYSYYQYSQDNSYYNPKVDYKTYSSIGVEQTSGNLYTGAQNTNPVGSEVIALSNGTYLFTYSAWESPNSTANILTAAGLTTSTINNVAGGKVGTIVPVKNSDGTDGFVTYSVVDTPPFTWGDEGQGQSQITLNYYSNTGTLISSTPNVASGDYLYANYDSFSYQYAISPSFQLYAGHEQGTGLIVTSSPNAIATGGVDEDYTIGALLFDQADTPLVTLSTNNTSISEAAGVATITATISAAATADTIVTLSLAGTASGTGVDYTAAAPTITILAGNLTGTTTLTAVQDTLDEIDETIIVGIQSISGGDDARADTGQITVSITDDDAPPAVSIAPASVTEGDAGTVSMVFTVTLDTASGKAVSVNYATSNGTATAGSDYTAASGTLNFAAGETSKQITVQVAGDTVTEPDETFTLTLSTPNNASLGTASATGTILDDENLAPVLATPSPIPLTDTVAADSFTPVTGALSATDSDGVAGYGITGSAVVNEVIGGVTYDLSHVGTYGTLYLASSTGAYAYVPDAAAINALGAGPQSDNFTVSATDSNAVPATATASLVINVTGANDAPTALSLSNASVDQSGGTNAVVGSFATTDAETGQTHTYSLVTGNGVNDTGNPSFSIAGSNLRAIDAATLAAGDYRIFVRTSDGQGGSFDKALTITVVDDVPPSTTFSAIAFDADTGASDADFVTKLAAQTITATLSQGLAAGEQVFASVNAGVNWTNVTASVSGSQLSWNSATLLPGPGMLQLKVVDAANNDGTVASRNYTLDTSSPDAPTLTSAALTKNASPVIAGTADADSSITVTVAGATYTTVATGGNWSIDLATASPTSGSLAINANGNNAVSVTATDLAGNVSDAGVQTLGIDTTIPASPTITSAALTKDVTPLLSGLAEAGALVAVTIGGATYAVTAAGGAWQVDVGTAVAVQGTLALNLNGNNAVSAVATDAAGNVSNADTQTLVIDATPPAAPSVTSAALTRSVTPVIAGTAEVGALINVLIGGATYTATATGGNWSVDLSTATPVLGTLALDANGNNLVSATATDAAGNVSSAGTQTLVVDTTRPASPVITSAALTNELAPIVSGTADADALITVSIGGATYTVAATGGAWQIDLSTAAPTLGTLTLNANGNNPVSVTASDAAGNVSTAGTQTLMIDTTPPAVPGITSAALTNNAKPVISGTAEPGAIVTVLVGGATYQATVSGGTWSVDLDVATPTQGLLLLNLNGDNPVSATATDAAGNPSNAGTQTLVIDSTSPATVFSVVSFSADRGTDNADFITNAPTQIVEATLSMAPAAGDKVFGSVDGVTWVDITASVSGTALHWENVSLVEGQGALRLKVTDAAGNDSDVFDQAYTLDTTPPTTTAPATAFGLLDDTGASAADLITQTSQQTLSGALNAALQPGEAVEVSVDGGTTWATAQATVGTTTWSAAALTLLAGSNMFSVRVSDAAGNHGDATTRNYVLDTGAPQFGAARVNGASLVLSFTDTTPLDAVNRPAAAAFAVTVGGVAVVVNAVSVNASAKTVTLSLASAVTAGQAVTVAYTDPDAGDDVDVIQDAAGNDAATFAAVTAVNDTPTVPTIPTTPTVPTTPSTPVDGVPVQVGTGTDGLPQITVPVVTEGRPEDGSTANSQLADIPLVKNAAGVTLLAVAVPVGTGLVANGASTPLTGSAAQTQLDSRIDGATSAPELKAAGQAFLSSLPSGTPVLIQTITLSAQATTGGPLVISAGNLGDGHRTVLVIDTSALPADTRIELENVDFAIIVGNARVTGGAGANVVYGDDDRQFIVLGDDDDVLHGGGDNDTVGSLRGSDQTFGDAGDDIVYGGTGNDTLHGGAGNDRLNGGFGLDTGVQSGVLADYTVALDGFTVVLTHKVSGEVDRFLDVEHISFDTGRSIIVAHDAGDVAALTAQFAGAQLIELNANRSLAGTDARDDIAPVFGVGLNIDLGAGVDIVRIAGARTDVHIDVEADQRAELTRLDDGAMLAFNDVELLAFANGDVTVLAHNHDEAVIGRTYELLLGRNVDTDGYAFWVAGLRAGVSLHDTLTAILQAPEYTEAASSNSAFVELLYTNGLGRSADAEGKGFWVGALDAGFSRALVIEGFAGSTEAATVIGSTIDVTAIL